MGWVLHSAVGVPYQAWKISHGRHHAGCGHIARDEVYVPRTREQLVRFDTVRLTHICLASLTSDTVPLQGYPAFDETKEDHEGMNVTAARRAELGEAIGDAPLYVLGDLLIQQVRVVLQLALTKTLLIYFVAVSSLDGKPISSRTLLDSSTTPRAPRTTSTLTPSSSTSDTARRSSCRTSVSPS